MSYTDLDVNSNSDYLKFTAGNIVTFNLLTKNPTKTIVHFNQNKRFSCMGKECDLCANGNKPKQRWAADVWDRKDNAIKKIEFGPSIAGQFKSIAEMMAETGKTIHDTDIRIKTTGASLETEYSVLAIPMTTPIPQEVRDKYEVPF